MDSPPVDTPTSSAEKNETPPAVSTESRSLHSRATSASLTDAWAVAVIREPVVLPPNLEEHGNALKSALYQDGPVSTTYAAFADAGFGEPATIAATGLFLTQLFSGQQAVLIDLVRTKDLLAEIENGSSELTRMVVMRWEADGLAQRISKFGDSLLQVQDRLKNPVAAEVEVAIAGLLALKKPERAAALLDHATGIMGSSGNVALLEDVRSWLHAGRMLETMPHEDRLFWQHGLRIQQEDGDWTSPEALRTLQTLKERLTLDAPSAGLFEQVVPAAWWAANMLKQGTTPPLAESAPAPVEIPAALPVTNASDAHKTEVIVMPEPQKLGEPGPAPVEIPAPLPVTDASDAHKTEVIVIPEPQKLGEPGPAPVEIPANLPVTNASDAHKTEVIVTPEPQKEITPPLPKPVRPPPRSSLVPRRRVRNTPAPQKPAPPATTFAFVIGLLLGMALITIVWALHPDLLLRASGSPQGTVPAATKAPAPPSAGDHWRLAEAAKLATLHPTMKLWIAKAQDGTWNDCGALISGQSPVAYSTMEDYHTFLKWLMLAPPANKELRSAVAKFFAQTYSEPDLTDLCEHLTYPGSVNATDIPTLAEIALNLQSMNLKPADRMRLQKLASAK